MIRIICFFVSSLIVSISVNNLIYYLFYIPNLFVIIAGVGILFLVCFYLMYTKVNGVYSYVGLFFFTVIFFALGALVSPMLGIKFSDENMKVISNRDVNLNKNNE